MKRVRKYTYLPQEEIEVIETKSGETIKSKEILDGNYIKARPTPKKIVKKVAKRKYAKGGELGYTNKFQEVNDSGNESYYIRKFGIVEDENDKKIELVAVANIKDLEEWVSDDELPEDGNFLLSITLVPLAKYMSKDKLEEANDEETSAISDNSEVNVVNYMGGLNYNPEEQQNFKTLKDALKYLHSKELNDKISNDGKTQYVLDNRYNRAGSTNLDYLNYMIGISERFAKGGKLVGNQKKLDVNKNGKLDAEDFTMLRANKMANGGSIQDIEKYVAKKYFNGDERGFSVSKNMKGKYDFYIDNHEQFEADYGDSLEQTNKIEEDINKKFQTMADGGMMDKGSMTYFTNIPIKISSRIVREAAKHANEYNRDVKIYYSTNDKQFYYSMLKPEVDDLLAAVVSPTGEVTRYDDGGMMANGGTIDEKVASLRKQKEDLREQFNNAQMDGKNKDKLLVKIQKVNNELNSALKEKYSSSKMADGGMMANGGMVSLSNHYKNLGKKDDLLGLKVYDKNNDEYVYIKNVDSGIFAGKNKNDDLGHNYSMSDLMIEKMADGGMMADGGKVTDKEVADSNVEMLHSNIKSIKHHAEELENAVKGNIEVEGWVLAKADRAATAMSDITHYLDGRKMGNGGMVVGYYYNDKNGENLRYVGPDSRDEKMGIFKNGDKYIQKPYNDFEEEPKNSKLFGFFGNGGYMPKGTSRKLTVAEKAEEMVGRNTWKTLDAAEKAGVIGELISDGALAITMEGGGIIDENDWNASSTDEKIYALKKAGYSNNMASELSLLPYEQLPMWVREDFRKGVIVIGDYHIHKNRMSSPIPLDMGYVLVLNGDEEVVFSAKTLEEAKEWANEQVRLDEEESEDYEMVSDCCGAPQGEITDLCPECREHCGWEKMYYAEGGVTEAVRFKVIYKIKDAEPKEKIFDNAENAEFFLETIKEDDDIESANLVEVKPEKKVVEKKVTNLFAAAKPAAATSASKKGKEDVFVNGIADEITRYDALKAIIKNAEAEQGVIGDRLKEVGVDKFLELYELRRRNPDTFNLADEDKKIMFIVMDKYKKVEPEKAEMLANYEGLLETITTYKFNPELLDRTGEIVSRLIMESSELSDDEKANLIIAETKTQIQKGAIDRLLDYDNPAQIFTLIEPILALK